MAMISANRVLDSSQYLQETAPEAIQGKDIKIEFVSILALAQRATGASNLERMLSIVGNVAQVDPQVLDKFDTDKFIDEYAEIIGASPMIFRDPKVVEQMRADRAKQQQIAQQQALLQQQADTQNQNANTARTVSEINPQTINELAVEGGFADA